MAGARTRERVGSKRNSISRGGAFCAIAYAGIYILAFMHVDISIWLLNGGDCDVMQNLNGAKRYINDMTAHRLI